MEKYRSYLGICLACTISSAHTLSQRGVKRRKQITPTPALATKSTPSISLAPTRPIEVNTNIPEKALEYSHWTGRYTPKLHMKINNTPVALNGTTTCPVAGDLITVRFDYTFMNGYRKGAKEVTYRMNPNAKKVEISFDWNSKWRIIVNNAEPLDIKEVPFSA